LGLELSTELASVFLGHIFDRFSGLDLTIPPVQFSGTTSAWAGSEGMPRCLADSPEK